MLGHLRDGDLIIDRHHHAERETLDRVQAVMAVIEGHAEHVMDAVAPDLLPSLPKLRAALDRRRRSQSGLSRLLAKLLGLELKLRQYEQGKYFCDAIVRERGPKRSTICGPRPRRCRRWPSCAIPTPGSSGRCRGSFARPTPLLRTLRPSAGSVHDFFI